MDKIAFTNCAVAFLDILGFKEFIAKAEKPETEEFREFCNLQNVVRRQMRFTSDDGHKQSLFPKSLGLKFIYISDSFILSAPFDSVDRSTYSGLVAVSIKTIQLAHQLLKMGFLLRGGISVGNIYRTDSNIFGTGYQNSYETESKYAANPRVLLHQSAVDALKSDHHGGLTTASLSIFMKEGEQFMLDTLNTHWSYVGNRENCNINKIYNGYKATIERNLEKLSNSRAREKWEWMAKLFNAKRKDSSDLRDISEININKISKFTFGHTISTETFKEAFAQSIAEPRYVTKFLLPDTTEG
jgi:hypothetical protein